MTGRLSEKVCLVMGGGSASHEGVVSNGQAVAVSFAREGATVVAVDRNLTAAEETASRILEAGGVAVAMQADVCVHDEVRSVVAETVKAFGRIDVLYNNVGFQVGGGIVDMSEADWDRVHEINLKSVFLACKEVIPLMEAQGGGSIINVSSVASLMWSPVEFVSYSSSKAALNHMTRVMARQYAPKAIRCNVIVPGMIDTPHVRVFYKDKSPAEVGEVVRTRNATCPMGRQGTSWEVANAAVFLASDEASYVSGVLLTVDGALSCR